MLLSKPRQFSYGQNGFLYKTFHGCYSIFINGYYMKLHIEDALSRGTTELLCTGQTAGYANYTAPSVWTKNISQILPSKV